MVQVTQFLLSTKLKGSEGRWALQAAAVERLWDSHMKIILEVVLHQRRAWGLNISWRGAKIMGTKKGQTVAKRQLPRIMID